jgi:peroxiredoxin
LKRPGSGTLSLLIAAALFAAGVGAWVGLFQPPPAPALRAGGLAPEFALPLSGGGEVSLASLRGKVVFVNFWATWCTPCRLEAPSLQRLYKTLKSDGFEVLGVSIDKADAGEAVGRFKSDFALDFPIPLDPDRTVYNRYGASGVPETYLVAPDGKLLERFVGPQNWDDPRYVREIRRALAAAGTRSGGSPSGS